MSDDDEYESAKEDSSTLINFNIYDKIISQKNENTFLIKLSFRELLNYTDTWSYNRKIVSDKVDELYETLCENYDIPWTLHAIYDDSLKNSFNKILILDGQHRKKAIEKYIQNYDIHMKCNDDIWMWIYRVKYSETSNSHVAVNLFKKINNNRQFEENELPNTLVIELVKQICENENFKNGIKMNDANNKSHSPFLHKKELNTLFNENIYLISNMKQSDIILNLQKINNILSIKNYEQLYGKKYSQQNERKLQKAISIKFYLNLGPNSKFPTKYWIKYINDVDNLP